MQNTPPPESKTLTFDGCVTGCSGAIVGGIATPFLVLGLMLHQWSGRDFGPLALLIPLGLAPGIGAAIGWLLGQIGNQLIRRKLHR